MNISRNVSNFKDAVGGEEGAQKQQRTRCINNRATEKLIPMASEWKYQDIFEIKKGTRKDLSLQYINMQF